MLISLEALGPFLWRSMLLVVTAYLLNATLFRKCPAHRYATLLIILFAFPVIWLSASVSFDLPTIKKLEAAQLTDQIVYEISRASRQWNAPGAWITQKITDSEEKPDRAFDFRGLFFFLWVGGVSLFLIKHLISQTRLYRLMRSANPVGEGLLYERFIQIRSSLKASPRIQLLETKGLLGPAAAGVISPVVFIPADLKKTGHEETLTHEVLHHCRKDLLFHHLAMLIRAVFWFHPLVHLMIQSLGLERERAVDLKVVEVMGDPQRYIERLRDSVLHRVTEQRPVARATALLDARPSQVRRRIEMLLNYTRFKTSKRPIVFATSLLLLFGMVFVFLAMDSCASPEQALDETIVIGKDDQGLYRLWYGFDTVSKVCVGPIDVVSGQKTLYPKENWTFNPKKHSLSLKQPVDLKKKMVHVYGKRTVPWVFSTFDQNGSGKLGKIQPGTVEITLGERSAEEGVDFEVDYQNGFIRFLKKEICRKYDNFGLNYAYPPDPKTPSIITSFGISAGGSRSDEQEMEERRRLGLPVYAPEENVNCWDVKFIHLWKTSDPRVFILKRPVKGHGFKLSLNDHGSRKAATQYLKNDVDFEFDEEKQKVTLTSADLYQPDRQYMNAWGIPEDECTYQFPGPIKKGSVHYIFRKEELKEGQGFVVDYERNRVTLKDRLFEDTFSEPGMQSTTPNPHAVTIGEWRITYFME